MFKDPNQDADASNFQHEPTPEQLPEHETVRHILFGSLTAVRNTITLLHKLNYAEPNDWSKPLPTGRAPEVMDSFNRRGRGG